MIDDHLIIKPRITKRDWKTALLDNFNKERNFDEAIDDTVERWKRDFFANALSPRFEHPNLEILKQIPPGSFSLLVDEVKTEATKVLAEYHGK